MIRIAVYLAAVLALIAGLHWLANRPGTVTIEWMGHIAELSVLSGLVLLATLMAAILLAWSVLRRVWHGPAVVAGYLSRRRQQRGLDALSSGLIAAGAGDRALAAHYAALARKAVPHEPLTHLLRAQAAQLTGDRITARRIFEAMLAAPDTEQLGLRGLFLEAEREGEREAARQLAERALRVNPRLGWPVEALLDLQCRAADWTGALETLAIAETQNLVDKATARRRRAVLLAAQAQSLEDDAPDRALELALEAHGLARDLVPAAATAGRILAARGRTPKAARVLLRTWRHAPHPDLAVAYAYARPGDSPRDRLERVRHLARLTPNHPEALIAVATSAIEARAWDEAREVLKPLLDGRLTPRVCALMARIEGEQYRDAGRVREWLARATSAAPDPAWVADGTAYPRWSPVSPATGQLDAMRWEVPERAPSEDAAQLAARLETLLGLGGAGEVRVEAATPEAKPAPALPAEQVKPEVPAPRPAPAPQPAAAAGASGRAAPPRIEEEATSGAGDAPRSPGRTAAPVPTADVVATPRPRIRKPAEPRIFVSPRAPDDPGTEASDLDDLQGYPTKA